VRVCGGVVRSGDELLNGDLAPVLATPAELAEVDAIVMEGGWNDPEVSVDRLPLGIAKEFVATGGVLVVADLDRNKAVKQRTSIDEAKPLLKSTVHYGEILGHTGVRYLYDPGAIESRNATRFFTSQMEVERWLEPALQGIDSLLTWGAIDLMPAGGVAASGNHGSTQIHVNDLAVEVGWTWPWAAASDYGSGYVALLAALITADDLVDACPDNARWMSNLLALLADRARENQDWSAPRPGPADDGMDLHSLLSQNESQRLERKSSFLVPTDPNRPMPTEAVQLNVGKSIAALANTDGGHVIVGQADDLRIVGLAADFNIVRGKDRDGFELKLVEYCDKALQPRWEVLGLRLHWAEHPEGDIAIIEVPKSSRPVYLKTAKADHAVYVRRGTRTDELTVPQMLEWSASRSSG
jgi:hypothetical protein